MDTNTSTKLTGSNTASQLVGIQTTRNINIATDIHPLHQPKQRYSQTDLEKRQAHCGLKQLPKGTIKHQNESLGEGGFGKVYKGTLTEENGNQTNVIIKEDKNTDTDTGIKYETQVSSDLINKAKENLAKDDNLISSQEGFANVVFQQEINGQHVQRRVNGVDGSKAIDSIYDESDERIDLYKTETGHPKNIEQPLMLAQQLLNGIHAIHEQEMIHSDLKAGNIILEETSDGVNLKIIDLGGAVKFGQQITTISLNCAPEILYAYTLYNKFGPATPQADIYTAGTVLCELLFGHNNGIWEQQFWVNQDDDNESYCSEYQSDTDPKSHLQELLKSANKLSNEKQLYPDAIYNVIEDLIVRMCAIDPTKRPSSQYCLAVLNDLVLCDHDEIRKDTTGNIKPMVTGTLSQAIDLIADLNELNKEINKLSVDQSKLNKELSETNEKLTKNDLALQKLEKGLPRLSMEWKLQNLRKKENKTETDNQEITNLTNLLREKRIDKSKINTNNLKTELTAEIKQLESKREELLNQKKLLDTKEVLIYNLGRDFEISQGNETLKSDLQKVIGDVIAGNNVTEETLKSLKTACENDIQQQMLLAYKIDYNNITHPNRQQILKKNR